MKHGFRTMDDLKFAGKTVLCRVDINCPIDRDTGNLLDTKRITAHAKTIRELSDKKAKTVILAHQGRPGEEYDFIPLKQHAKVLEKEGVPINYIGELFSRRVSNQIKKMKPGEVLLLQNLRFYSEEVLNRPAKEHAKTHLVSTLAVLSDYFVNDAFAAAHRSHASIVGFTELLPSCAGRVMENEIDALERILVNHKSPSVIVLGGSKLESPIEVVKRAVEHTDKFLMSGVMANLFLVASGYNLGDINLSYLKSTEYDKLLREAEKLLDQWEEKIVVPEDLVFNAYSDVIKAGIGELPLPYQIVDIGPETIKTYSKILRNAKTIFANGAAGIVERKEFANGTEGLVKAIAESNAFSVIGGGHIISVMKRLSIANKITHISTGGGACMLYLAGKKLPAIEALKDNIKKFKRV